jgi:hypothetical protein
MATEQVAEMVVEEVAQNLEEAAEATRRINPSSVGYFFVGLGIGLGIGFFYGYRYNKEKIRAEAFMESEAELDKMKQYYQQKEEGVKIIPAAKPSAEEIVEERGYSVEEEEEVPERPLPPPVPVTEPRAHPVRTEEEEKDKHDGWSYPHELSKRSPDHPYIIHQDEFAGNETDYTQVTYTYYAQDEILTDEHDDVLSNVDELVGERNLTRFGHGSDDFNVLYVRNSKLELEFEICRVPKSFEQEVMGLEHSDPSYERMRRRDHDDETD